jgi:hypothetical protein
VNSRAFFTYGTVAMLGIAGGVMIGPILSGVLALGLIVVVCASGVTLVYIALDVLRVLLGTAMHRASHHVLSGARRPASDA